MINWIVTHQALIREVINGLAMVLFLTLSLMVMVFMWDTWVSSKPGRDWRGAPGIPTACSLWWVFAAETYRTGAIWYLYNIGKPSGYIPDMSDGVGVFETGPPWNAIGYIVAGVMLVCGLQRSIFIFTPPEWKRRVWVYASIAGVVFCFLPTVYNLIGNFYNGI
jgi:hypothetical protein